MKKTFTDKQTLKASEMRKSGMTWQAIGEILSVDGSELRAYCESIVGRSLPDKQEKAAAASNGKVVGRWVVDRQPMPEKIKRRCRELETLAGTLNLGDHVSGLTLHEVYSLREHLAKRNLYPASRIETGEKATRWKDARYGVWILDIKDAPKRKGKP